MKATLKKGLTLLMFFSCFLVAFVCHAQNAPTGYWKTIDDKTHVPKSIVKIWETSNHTLQGRIMTIYPSPGKDIHEVCSNCKGPNHNKPMVGMAILWGLKFDGEKWTGGEILDPKSGNIYHCNIKVIQGGDALEVHGYIGIPILGRTQQWIRVNGM